MFLKNEYDEKDGGLLFSIFIGVVIVASLVIDIIIGIIASLRDVNTKSILNNAITGWVIQGALYAALLGVVLFYHKSQKINFIKANGLDKKFTIADIIMSVVLGLGMLFSFLIITFLYSYFLQEIGYKSDGGFFEINNFGTFLAGVLIICVLPAITEETVFRGAVLKGYSKVFSIAWAVIISALFFMLMHMNPSQFVNALLCGVVMAIVVQKTKTLKTSMIAHFTNNFILILITYIQSFSSSAEQESEHLILNKEVITGYLIYFAVGIILLSGSLFYFFILRKRDDLETVQKSKPVFPNDDVFFGDNKNEVATFNVVNNKNKKTRALLYASFGIIAAVAIVLLNIFLPG